LKLKKEQKARLEFETLRQAAAQANKNKEQSLEFRQRGVEGQGGLTYSNGFNMQQELDNAVIKNPLDRGVSGFM
jgi:hypothetical protein